MVVPLGTDANTRKPRPPMQSLVHLNRMPFDDENTTVPSAPPVASLLSKKALAVCRVVAVGVLELSLLSIELIIRSCELFVRLCDGLTFSFRVFFFVL